MPSASSRTCTAASGRLTKVWAVCQTFAQFGRPIHFTETTVISGPRRDNPTNATLPGLEHDARRRGEAGRLRRAVLYRPVQPPVRPRHYLVGLQRPERLAGRPGGPGAQGHVPQARLHAASGPDSQTVVDKCRSKNGRSRDSHAPGLLRGLHTHGHGRARPVNDPVRHFSRGRPTADRNDADAVVAPRFRLIRLHR